VLNWSKKMENDSDELAVFKARKAADKFHSLVWYCFISAYAWSVMRDQTWLPWFLGGEGELANGFTNMPFTPID